MKSMQALFFGIAGLILTFTVSVSAQNTRPGVVTVVGVKGPASYTLESGTDPKWIPLVAGKVLTAGATIRTGPNALVDLVLAPEMVAAQGFPIVGAGSTVGPADDAPVRGLVSYNTPMLKQNVVRMSGDTVLKIDKLTAAEMGADTVSDTELDLQKGSIFSKVKKLSETSVFYVKIPTGIASVRGTSFFISAEGNVSVLAESNDAKEHTVVLAIVDSSGQQTTYTIRQGFVFNAAVGTSVQLNKIDLKNLKSVLDALQTLFPNTGPKGNNGGNENDNTIIHVSPVK
jgi:hypothetical protein